MKQGNKGLTLREYQEKRHSDLELTPKKVSNWVRNLPVTNLANSSKIIYHVLIDVNHSAMEADDRLDILNTIETIACELITSLESQFIQKSINLSDKQKKIVALIQAIHTELCLGYHTVIEAVESDDPKRSHKKLLHTALTMAIRYHALVILKCLTLYAAVPNRIWREVYIIFQIAQKHGLDKKEFTVSHSDETFSIYNHFVRVLLLSISNTCQLRQQDIILTWELLPKIIEHVTLMTHAYNKHHFVVPMIPEEAGPPIHKSIYKSRHNTIERPVNLKLTAYTAVDHIKHLIESTQETDNQANRKIMIYKHLIQTWQTSVHRAFNRNACSESLHISIGLSATHYQLSQIVSAESTNVQATAMDAMEGSLKNASIMHTSHRPQKITQSKMNYLSSSSAPDEDVWARLYTTKEEMRSALNRMDPNKRSKEVIARESYQLRKVDVIDVSPNGYCIQINAENLPSNAQSGEIIGFLDTQSKDLHAGIGLIRWVRRLPKDDIIQMGVQILAPNALPANIQLRNSKADSNEYQKALLLPAISGVGQPESMVTNALTFNTHSKIRVMQGNEKFDGRLLKVINFTSSVRHFEFEKTGEKKKQDIMENLLRDPSFDSNNNDISWDIH